MSYVKILVLQIFAGWAMFSGSFEAKAAPKPWEVLVKNAKIECSSGNFQAGVRLLAEAYAETNDAVLIYNQARCYEQNNQREQAINRFEEYLRVGKSVTPDESDAIKRRIDALRGSSGEVRPSVAKQEKSLESLPEINPAKGYAMTSERNSIIEPSNSQELPVSRDPPIYKRWWFWSGIGAVVVGGVVTGILLSQKSPVGSPACDLGGPQCVR